MPAIFGTPWWPILVFPAFTALVMIGFWLWRGRDGRGTFPHQSSWQPPLELSPAQVGTLVDEKCDTSDIVATLVDLAARGFLSIGEVGDGDLILKNGDLRFVRGNGSGTLKTHEKQFLRALFDPHPPDIEFGKRPANSAPSDELWNETALSLLKNKFYRHIPAMQHDIYASLMAEGFFPTPPQKIRAVFTGIGFPLMYVAFRVLLNVSDHVTDAFSNASRALPLGLLLSGAVIWASAPLMSAKTAFGAHKAAQARRFPIWVQNVESNALRAYLAKNPNGFERLLPYAIVLGVGELWAQKCHECGEWTPLWFVSKAPNARESVVRLTSHLEEIARVLTCAPPAAKS